MKAKNLNASSVKTRNLIRDTFAELLYEKKNIKATPYNMPNLTV